jgi:hypothetical protein
LLAIVVTIPFVDVLFSDSRFFVRDLSRYYYPTKKILREIALSGEFPHWNRHYSAGQPMAANPEYEVFYPLQWLILLPDYDLGYRLHIIIHIYVAAFGMYFLLRSMWLRVAASLFGAIAFASGGVMLSYVNLLPILFAVAWIPWIGWLLLRALRAPSVARVGAASFVVGIQGLVGEPTTLVQTWAMALVLAGWVGWQRGRWSGAGRAVAVAGLVLVIGFAGAAVQLVTAADHVGDSARARPFSFELITTWSMHPARPLELVAPHVFGHLFGERTYWGSGMYRNTASPFIFGIYLGLPIAVLAAASFFGKIRGRVMAVIVMSGSYVLALGEHTPLYRVLYDLDLARTVRYPEKFIFPALLTVVILGATGLDRLLRRDRSVRRVALALSISILAVSGLMCVVAFTPLVETMFERLWRIHDEARLANLVPLVRQDWGMSLLRSSALVGLLWGAFRLRRRFWLAAMLAFVLVDLTPAGVAVLPRIDRSFFETPPAAGELDAGRGDYRLFHEMDWYGRGETARKYFQKGEQAYWVVRNGMFPMTPAGLGFDTVLERDYDKTALLPTVDFVAAMWQVRDAGQARWREIFGAMSNVGYRATYRPYEAEWERVGGDPREVRPVDWVKTDPAPRYYFADQVVQLDGPGRFATRLVREEFSPGVAFVEMKAFEPAGGRVVSVDESANGARIVVEAEGRALFVASVTRHRYWSATVDGRPVRLEPVNVAYQGLVLDAGRHEVVMKYRNPLVLPLGAISLVTLAGCLVAAALPWLRSRSRASA